MRIVLGMLALVLLVACDEANQPPPANPSTPRAPAAPAQTAPKVRLEPSDIQDGMRALKPRFQVCYDTFRVPGMVLISMTIAPTGRVSKAIVTGRFANTPTGDCVAAVTRTAVFVPFTGGQLTITYPLVFR
jgi:hypothetical protein